MSVGAAIISTYSGAESAATADQRGRVGVQKREALDHAAAVVLGRAV